MRIVKEAVALVGVSELRTRLDEVLRLMGRTAVILERRHKPLAALLPIARYEKMEELLDWVEDRLLGVIAKERLKGTSRKDYLSIEEVQRRLKLR